MQVIRTALIASLPLLAQCASRPNDVAIGTHGASIVGGRLADAPDSPVLYLRSPQGGCTAVLVAPNLVVTARHCVAKTTAGEFACTPGGELILTASGAGQVGDDHAPLLLTFFTSSRVASGEAAATSTPDALGARILSTKSPSVCRDDLAFVVLDREIPGAATRSVRMEHATRVGEAVSVWGYGLTEQVDSLALRSRDDAQIAGVGPDVPASDTQAAPVRAVRLGAVTCEGDSGGPIVALASGAVVAIVSLGSQAGAKGPFCGPGATADTVGPRLAAYPELTTSAFRAAGASLHDESVAADAATGSEGEAGLEAGAGSGGHDASTDAGSTTAARADGGCAWMHVHWPLPKADVRIAALMLAALSLRRRRT